MTPTRPVSVPTTDDDTEPPQPCKIPLVVPWCLAFIVAALSFLLGWTAQAPCSARSGAALPFPLTAGQATAAATVNMAAPRVRIGRPYVRSLLTADGTAKRVA